MHRLLTSAVLLRFPTVIALGLLAATGCSNPPTAPAGSSGSLPVDLAAKPSGSPATSHSVSFTDPGPGSDGYLTGGGTLGGSFTGSSSAGNLLGSATGPATVTVTDVFPLPPGASTPGPCPEGREALILTGILGKPLSGSLTINVDQDGSGGGGFAHSEMTWEMTNISYGGATWKLNGYSTFNYPAAYQGTATAFTATLTSGAIGFNRYSNGSRKADLVVGCRVDLVMTVTRP